MVFAAWIEAGEHTELLCAGSVEDLKYALSAIHLNHLTIRVFDSRVIALDPHILNELCCVWPVSE